MPHKDLAALTEIYFQMCVYVCVRLCVMWYNHPHPDVGEGPVIYKDIRNVKHKKPLMWFCISCLCMSGIYFISFCFIYFSFLSQKSSSTISLLDDGVDICISLILDSVCRTCTGQRPKLQNAAPSLLAANKTDLEALVRETWIWQKYTKSHVVKSYLTFGLCLLLSTISAHQALNMSVCILTTVNHYLDQKETIETSF